MVSSELKEKIIGIPRAMSFYNNYPFYFGFFNDLGIKIVLSDVITLDDYEKVENLIKEYDSIKDRIYVNFIFNNGYVSIEDAYKTIKIIKNKAEEILKLNMSPFENIM